MLSHCGTAFQQGVQGDPRAVRPTGSVLRLLLLRRNGLALAQERWRLFLLLWLRRGAFGRFFLLRGLAFLLHWCERFLAGFLFAIVARLHIAGALAQILLGGLQAVGGGLDRGFEDEVVAIEILRLAGARLLEHRE